MGLTGRLGLWENIDLPYNGLHSTVASAEVLLWISRIQHPGRLASTSLEESLQLIGNVSLLLRENQFIDAQFLYSLTSRIGTQR